MIKLVAFDWNGTLFADTYACLEAINQVLKFLGSKPISVTRYRQTFTVPIWQAYVTVGFDKDFILRNTKQIAKVFHSFYEPRASKVRTRKNAKKILSFLAKHQIDSVIFSNHLNDPIQKQLERLKIKNYFLKVLANSQLDSSLKERHKEVSLKNFIRDQKLKPDQILIVGDSTEEVEIGQKIGATTVALTGGNYTTPRLKAAKPDYLIHNLGELITIIKQIKTKGNFQF